MAKKGGKKHSKRLNAPSTRADEAEAMRPVLEARCLRMGWQMGEANLRRMKAPWFADHVGRSIVSAANSGDVPELWDTVQHIRKVLARYRRAIAAPDPNPKVQTLEMMPEQISSGAEHYVQAGSTPLTEEEIVDRALAAHEALWRAVKAVPHDQRVEIVRVVMDDKPCRYPVDLVAGLVVTARELRGDR